MIKKTFRHKPSQKSKMLNENDSLSSIGLVKQIQDIQGLSENEDKKVIEDYTTMLEPTE